MNDAVTPADQDEAAERGRKKHADRQWLYRQRRKDGRKPIMVDLYADELAVLIEHGLLTEADRADQAAVGEAVGVLVSAAIRALRKGELRI